VLDFLAVTHVLTSRQTGLVVKVVAELKNDVIHGRP